MDDKIYFHAFNLTGALSPRRFKKLIDHFPTLENAWDADEEELARAGLEREALRFITPKKSEINPEREWEKLIEQNIRVITIKEKGYPALLREIYDPPALLYIRGGIKEEDGLALGIVGTRRATLYGKQITPEIVKDLAEKQITIVSGLAIGIDSLAHRAALEVPGRTIAVLGSGIDNQSIYPPINRGLAREIEKRGAIISEFPPGTLPFKQNFPQRNRIISGLSRGVLIVEAGKRSGALITAKYALEQNRDVFAVPGNIYQLYSFGPNNLIKMGAKPVTSSEDILCELNLELIPETSKRRVSPDTKEEDLILKHLSRTPIHVDKLVNLTKLDISVLNSTLALMEMKGKVKNLGGMNYVLTK